MADKKASAAASNKTSELEQIKIDEPEPEPKEAIVDDDSKALWDKLNKQANAKSRERFEKMITTKQWTNDDDSKEYKYAKVPREKQAELLNLLKASASLNKETDFMAYSENIKKRACIVIDGMTPEEFEKNDYEFMEDLTVAWSLKIRGFR